MQRVHRNRRRYTFTRLLYPLLYIAAIYRKCVARALTLQRVFEETRVLMRSHTHAHRFRRQPSSCDTIPSPTAVRSLWGRCVM